jgi:hypothetical protein
MSGAIPETHFEQPTNSTAKRCIAGPEEQRPLNRLADNVKDLAEHLHPPVPNPAPLGLIAFGLTTALVMIKHTRIGGEDDADLKGVDTVVMGFALFFGGLVQVRLSRGCFFFSRNWMIANSQRVVCRIDSTYTVDCGDLRDTTEQHLRVHGILLVRWLLDVHWYSTVCFSAVRRRRKS